MVIKLNSLLKYICLSAVMINGCNFRQTHDPLKLKAENIEVRIEQSHMRNDMFRMRIGLPSWTKDIKFTHSNNYKNQLEAYRSICIHGQYDKDFLGSANITKEEVEKLMRLYGWKDYNSIVKNNNN